MTLEEMLQQLQPGQDLEIKFTPHTAKILRAMADRIESGKEAALESKLFMSVDYPGVVQYSFIFKADS
ncbi:hypothetical protein AI2803V1_3694 [Klebsiella pneumoniae]|nr:hypothetical protein AI2803V1_3694 [Klebsiella pneumoniae]CAH5110629.1 hypothetical protein AI2803V1_3694 [Klebsiella pneumoniae]